MKITHRHARGSSTNRTRTQTGPGGTRTSQLARSKILRRQQPIPTKLHDPTPEELREYIRDRHCWWCETGPYKSLSQHVSQVHGINANQQKDLALMYYSQPIASPEYVEACRRRAKHMDMSWIDRNAERKRHKHCCSIAARQRSRKMINDYAQAHPNQRREALTKAWQKITKPHPCTVCGTTIPKGYRKTCSDKCENISRSRAAIALNLNRTHSAETKQRISLGLLKYNATRDKHPASQGIIPAEVVRTDAI